MPPITVPWPCLSTLFTPICCEIQKILLVFIALMLFMMTFAFDVGVYMM